MSTTISQHINALLASYVAIEAEQMTLIDLGTKEADSRAGDLGEQAIAIYGEINAIRDRSANRDLLAARILLDLMLGHPWRPEAGIDWSPEALSEALPLLEILSGGLTGAVRHEARRALATIGVEIPEAEADPLAALIADYLSGVAKSDAIPDVDWDRLAHAVEAESVRPFRERLESDAPAATSLAGVEAALDLIRREAGKGRADDLTASVAAAALIYFNGRA